MNIRISQRRFNITPRPMKREPSNQNQPTMKSFICYSNLHVPNEAHEYQSAHDMKTEASFQPSGDRQIIHKHSTPMNCEKLPISLLSSLTDSSRISSMNLDSVTKWSFSLHVSAAAQSPHPAATFVFHAGKRLVGFCFYPGNLTPSQTPWGKDGRQKCLGKALKSL